MGLFDAAPQQGYLDPNDRQMMLLAMGLGLMGAQNGANPFQALGRGGLAGLQLAMENAQGRRRDAYVQSETDKNRAEIEKMRAMSEGQKALQERLAAAGSAGSSPLSAMGPGGPTPANLAAVQGTASRPPILQQADQFLARANVFADAGMADQAKIMVDAANAIRGKFGEPKVGIGPSGKPVFAQWNEQGQAQITPNVTPPPDIKPVATGGTTQLIDMLTAQPGSVLQHTPTEGDKTAWARLAWEKAQAGKPQWNADLNTYVAPPQLAPGSTWNPPGTEPGKVPDKDLRALTTTLAQHVETLQAVKDWRVVSGAYSAMQNAPQDTAGDAQIVLNFARAMIPTAQGVSRGGLLPFISQIETMAEARKGEIANAVTGKGRLGDATRAKMIGAVTAQYEGVRHAADDAVAPVLQRIQNIPGMKVEEIIPPDLRKPPAMSRGGGKTVPFSSLPP